MNNKKGFTQWIFVIIAVVVVLFIILLSKGVIGTGKVTSLTPKTTDKKCDDIGVIVGGNVNIEDTGGITLNPSIKTIKVDEVKTSTGQTLCFWCTSAKFTYTVSAYDDLTGNKLDTFSGSGELRSGDNRGIDKPFSVNFIVPDNNCDRQVDDFNLRLVAELKSEDVGKVKTYSTLVRLRDGQWAR